MAKCYFHTYSRRENHRAEEDGDSMGTISKENLKLKDFFFF